MKEGKVRSNIKQHTDSMLGPIKPPPAATSSILERITQICNDNIDVDRSMTSTGEEIGLHAIEMFAKEILKEIGHDE